MSKYRAEHAALISERHPVEPGDEKSTRELELRTWRESAFLDDDTFAMRLRCSGLSEDVFSGIITGQPFQVDPGVTAWVEELDRVLAMAPVVDRHDITTRLYGESYDRVLFEGLIGKFVRRYEELLNERLQSTVQLQKISRILSGPAVSALLESLVNNLTAVSLRTLVLELNVARVQGELSAAGMGTSDDPGQAGYDFYNNVLLRDEEYLKRIFTEYPVLGRALVRQCGNWLEYSVELLGRLAADLPLLQDEGLLPDDHLVVTAIHAGLGDLHQGGRSVARIIFGNGSSLIYKPRSVEPEMVYFRTISLLNSLNPGMRLRAMRVIARTGYGWCEYLEHQPCADREAVRRFYIRVGGSLAALHLLGAVDIHMNNVLAVGEWFMPIDLETLLQPTSIVNLSSTRANERAIDFLAQSVLATLIVPSRTLSDGFNAGFDVSAISGGTVQHTTRAIPFLAEPFTDRMRIERRDVRTRPARNRPFLTDATVAPVDHVDEVKRGFLEAYDVINANKKEFSTVIGSVDDFQFRYLVRPTRRYDLFLQESFHPNYLRDALDTERLFEKLWTAAGTRPDLAPAVESEKYQLLMGDIPSFHTRPGSDSLYSGPNLVAKNFFTEPGGQTIPKKLEAFGADHRATQLAVLDDALSTLEARQPGSPVYSRAEPEYLDRDQLGGLTRRMISELADAALLGRNDCTWIGISIDGIRDESLDYKPLNTGMYHGLAGMSLMFACAAGLYQDSRYADLAERSITPVVEQLTDAAQNHIPLRVGAYDGIAGAFYAFQQLYVVTGDEKYVELMSDLLPYLLTCVGQETAADLVAGSAGCAVVAGDLYRALGFPAFREVVAACVERLGAQAVPAGDGLAWRHGPTDPLLGGFSHGTAGIGWALLKSARVLGDSGVQDLGVRALRYDSGLRIPGENTWRDLRGFEDRTGVKQDRPTLWCHGAMGIGMSRLLSYRLLPERGYLEDAEVALTATRDAGLLGNHCLCHGDFGNLELFRLAGQVMEGTAFDAQVWNRHRQHMTEVLVTSLMDSGFRFGNVTGNNIPGLMIGRAGVCMGLMRLIDEKAVPAVLWLGLPGGSAPEADAGSSKRDRS